MSDNKIIGYNIKPIYEISGDHFVNASVLSCDATGMMISGMGGCMEGVTVCKDVYDITIGKCVAARKAMTECKTVTINCEIKEVDCE